MCAITSRRPYHQVLWKAAALLLLLSLAPGNSSGQVSRSPLRRHEEVEVSFVALKFLMNAQEFGVQAEYAYIPLSWLAAGGGFSSSPTGQPLNVSTEYLGKGVDYNYGFIRAGKVFHKVGIYGSLAGGDTVQKVYVGQSGTGAVYTIRSTPTFSYGIKFEVPVSTRFTLNYSAQQNTLLYGDVVIYGGNTQAIEHGTTQHSQEARFGLGFHF